MAGLRTRSHHCGALNDSNLEAEVQLTGWVHKRRDHGGVIFIDLRDRYGLTQVVFDPNISGGADAHKLAHELRSEFVIWCKGKVRARPEGMRNDKLSTGAIEVAVTELEILSPSKTPPFPIEDEADVSENIRLQYRYLDLRRPTLQKNLIVRSKALQAVREYLSREDFVEVETPILYKSTPEGARDFVVPSRLNPGEFYALPQSPQTLKQLLMVAGMDRYYQVARCFRDEDFRADRQPEFSQIDIETSFLDEETFYALIEGMVAHVWKSVLGKELKTPFPRIPFWEAMHRYGSDKPDIRFGLELQDLSQVFGKSTFRVFESALATKKGGIRCIKVEGQADQFSRKVLDELTELAARYGAKGLLWVKVQEGGKLQSPAAKFFTEEEVKNFESTLGLKTGDLVLIIADQNDERVCTILGHLRLAVGERLGVAQAPGQGEPAFCWVTRFPLLEYDERENRYAARHHPFTSPRAEDVDAFVKGENLENIEAAAYDLALNGVEVAGGSFRIYRPDVQAAMFRALGMSEEEAKDKFGFFLDALTYGTPPHGGIAFGVERLTGILTGAGPIRDVMAFPKTQRGTCLMSGSPSTIAPEQLVEAGISLRPTQPAKGSKAKA